MSKYWIVLIIGLGLLFRVIGLSQHPAGFTPDEASFGYDAYSLLHTGRDQWGKPWPLVLESFGDYKMPLLTYLAIPSVALFGLTEFAVRLPNALFGVLAVWATYLLCKTVFDRKIALLASFLLALSPWHIAMSRGAFEANLTTFLLPLALYFYFLGKKKSWFLVLAAVIAGLNMFSYHSARLVTPLLFLGLLLIDWKSIKKDRNYWLAGIVATVVVLLTVVTYMQGAGARVASSGIFSLTGNDQRYLATYAGSPDIVSRLFYNKATFYSTTFIKNYVSYFSPQFLLTQGPAESTYGMIPGRGVIYLIELVFIASFVIYLIKSKDKKPKWLLLWLLLAPIPASLTIGPGHAANRAVIMLPALTIILALGASSIKNAKALIGILVLVGISTIFALHAYWYLQPMYGSPSMIFGAGEVMTYLNENKMNYDHIIVSKKVSEPHIYMAFYSKLDPTIYQQAAREWNYAEQGFGWVDQLPHYRLADFEFKLIDWQFELNSPGRKLIAGTPEEFPHDILPLYIVNYPNGKPAYYIVDTQTTGYAYAQ